MSPSFPKEIALANELPLACHIPARGGGGDPGAAVLCAALKETGTLEGHQGIVFAVSWASYGQRIATGSQDGKVRIWDQVATKSPRLDRALDDYKGKMIFTARFSPDSGAVLAAGDASAAGGPPTAVVRQVTAPLAGWDLKDTAVALAVARDAAKVAVAEDKRVSVRDLAAGTTRTFEDVTDNLRAIAWRDDPIASGDAKGVVALWELAGAEGAAPKTAIPTPNQKPVRALAFAPDKSLLFAATEGGVVRVLSTAQTPGTSQTIGEAIVVSAASANGTKLATAGLETPSMGTPQQVIHVWDGTANPTTFKPAGQTDPITAIGLSDDGNFVAWGIKKGHFGFAKSDGTDVHVGDTTASAMDVIAIAPSHDGTQAVLGYATGLVEVRKISDGTAVSLPSATPHSNRVNALAWKPGDLNTFYSASEDKMAKVWTLPGGASSAFMGLGGTPPHAIRALAVGMDGSIAVGKDNGDVAYWTGQDPTATLPSALPNHAGGVTATGAVDGRPLPGRGRRPGTPLRAWDLGSKQELQRLSSPSAAATSLAVKGQLAGIADPLVLVAGSSDKTLQGLPLATRRALAADAEVNVLTTGAGAVHAGLANGTIVSYAPDGTPQKILTVSSHKSVVALATAKDGGTNKLFAACDGLKSLQGGDPSAGTELGDLMLNLANAPKTVSADPTGRLVAARASTTAIPCCWSTSVRGRRRGPACPSAGRPRSRRWPSCPTAGS